MLPNSTIRGAALVLGLAAATMGAQAAEPVFTVAKYPVDATGTNAVAAKRKAIKDGRQAAFRSLLKRLVPAAAYSQIEQLKKLDPEPYIGSVRVLSEENSSTQYIATLDFSFEPDAVRTLLGQHGVTYVDRQAPVTHLVLVYQAPKTGAPAAMAPRSGDRAWRSVWSDLDLANSLTPLKLARLARATTAVDALLAADPAAISALADQHNTSQVIIAAARPELGSNQLHVTLAGQDAVGRFAVTTRYRLDDEDFVYSLELAAVIAQGVLEGRWKTRMAGGQLSGAGGGVAGGALSALEVLAEFSNLGHWQRQQQVLSSTPGVRDLQIGSLSGRSARIALRYPGGGAALQAALQTRGLTLENINGFWILR